MVVLLLHSWVLTLLTDSYYTGSDNKVALDRICPNRNNLECQCQLTTSLEGVSVPLTLLFKFLTEHDERGSYLFCIYILQVNSEVWVTVLNDKLAVESANVFPGSLHSYVQEEFISYNQYISTYPNHHT